MDSDQSVMALPTLASAFWNSSLVFDPFSVHCPFYSSFLLHVLLFWLPVYSKGTILLYTMAIATHRDYSNKSRHLWIVKRFFLPEYMQSECVEWNQKRRVQETGTIQRGRGSPPPSTILHLFHPAREGHITNVKIMYLFFFFFIF